MTKPILMSKGNPSGQKLEELLEARREELQQVRKEVQAKTATLRNDGSETALSVITNNTRIDGLLNDAALLLEEAELHQLHTLELLAKVGPDQGPEGEPRIGGDVS